MVLPLSMDILEILKNKKSSTYLLHPVVFLIYLLVVLFVNLLAMGLKSTRTQICQIMRICISNIFV